MVNEALDPDVDDEIAMLVAALDNDQIQWDGTGIGLMPALAGEPAERLAAIGVPAEAQLLAALEAPSKFIAAHVLLTLLTGVEHASPSWNGLPLTLDAQGGVTVDAGGQAAVIDQWRRWRLAGEGEA